MAPVSKSIERSTVTEEYRADGAVSVSPLLFRAIALLLLPQDVKVCSASCVPSPQSAVAPVAVAAVAVAPVAVAPVATCSTETKVNVTSLVESEHCVKSMSAPSTSVAVEKNDQVERISCRNHVRMNVCDRYASLADLCLVFGIEKKASKKEKQAKKSSKLATNTKDRSPTSSLSFSSSSNSSFPSADARYKPKLFGWGGAPANDAQKIAPGHTL